jgi:hypothetical protein
MGPADVRRASEAAVDEGGNTLRQGPTAVDNGPEAPAETA